MKKPMSEMTAQEFVEAAAALGDKYSVLALQLGKSHSIVSQYSTGKKKIPIEVAGKLSELLQSRAKQLTALSGQAHAAADVGHMIVTTNEIRQARERQAGSLWASELTLARKRSEPDTRVFPPYQCTPERFTALVKALRLWKDEITARLQSRLSDESRIRQHQLELADLRTIVGTLPQRVPYRVSITFSEWDVVSRALRWAETQGEPEARALYQHWRKHKGAGFPVERRKSAAAAEGLPVAERQPDKQEHPT